VATEKVERLMRSAGIPAIHLDSSNIQNGTSKLGGMPLVSVDFQWPRWNDAPLAFIAQLDLASLPHLEQMKDLPESGFLYFFYDKGQSTWGFDPQDVGSWRVIYSEDANDLNEATPPLGFTSEFIYKETFVSFQTMISYPSLERLGIDFRILPESDYDMEYKLYSQTLDNSPMHQFGGFPNAVQADNMEFESQLAFNGLYLGKGYPDSINEDLTVCSKDWQLLLQVDTDDKTGMMWGDCGRLYFWIRRQELAERDFSKVWMILQC